MRKRVSFFYTLYQQGYVVSCQTHLDVHVSALTRCLGFDYSAYPWLSSLQNLNIFSGCHSLPLCRFSFKARFRAPRSDTCRHPHPQVHSELPFFIFASLADKPCSQPLWTLGDLGCHLVIAGIC